MPRSAAPWRFPLRTAQQPREFVIYESSLSDILGVLVFYAWLDANGSLQSFTFDLLGGGAVSLTAAAIAALRIYYLINQLEGHVRFLPLIAGLICLYAVGKHQSAAQLLWIAPRGLITVLLFLSATNSGSLHDFPLGAVMLFVLATATLTAIAHRQAPSVPDTASVAEPAPIADASVAPPK